MIMSGWSFALVAAAGLVTGSDDVEQCDLYMAISSTSTAEVTRWGLFSGKDLEPGNPIGYPEVGINVPNLRTNSLGIEDSEEGEEFIEKIVTFFETFFWVPETIGAKYEQTSGRSVAAVPGAGVLGAYNKKLTNANWNVAKIYHRFFLGENSGQAHPGRGANSQFYNAEVIAKKPIKAGSEVFMDFGESWAEQNDDDDEDEDELTNDDFEKIDATVTQILDFFDKHKEVLDSKSKNEVYRFVTNDVLKAAVGAKKSRKVAQILPKHADELYKVKEAGGALAFRDPTIFRNVNWLSQFGFCMDNLRPGASTIPNAGRGAFTTRKIAKGKIVAPAPLTHFSDKRILNMYELKLTDDGEIEKQSNKIIGRQLLENYCYGHPQSSMILFPSGSGVTLINHSDEPNAKLVWSKHPSNQRHWLELDPIELVEEEYAFLGLIMEVVAIRDIEAGEEVFIDYGPEWKSAWEKHVVEWNTKRGLGEISETWPLRAADLNIRYIDKPFEPTNELPEPYPENVELKAFLMLADAPHEGTVEDPKEWDADDAFSHDNVFSVEVLAVKVDEDSEDDMPYVYTVRWKGKTKSSVITGVAHEALAFVDKPGTSDQFVSNSFRHYIGIPDEIFPQGPWRNLQTKNAATM